MAAARLVVGAPDDDVRVDLRLALVERDVAEQREHLHLLVERDPLVVPLRAVEVAQRHVAERADGREVRGAELLRLGEGREPGHRLVALVEDQHPGPGARGVEQGGLHRYTISRTRSRSTVSAIFSRLGSPRTSAWANFAACSSVIFGGRGGSKGSTTACTTTGPGVPSARSSTLPHWAGSSTVRPVAPHASATIAKSIGCRSQPYSGLPRKTICSHLIWPSVLFLMTTTFTGSR